jgi:uncharacterized membrane protein YbhN (UPF0104 family)
VAVGIITSLVVIVALRWLQLLKLIGHPISFFDSCRIVYVGLFFNQSYPLGSVAMRCVCGRRRAASTKLMNCWVQNFL